MQIKLSHGPLFIFFMVQPGIRISDSWSAGLLFLQWLCRGWKNMRNNPRTVTIVAHQQHFQLFDVTDQKLLGSTGQQMFHSLVAAIVNVEHQDLTLASFLHPVVGASGFLPVVLNSDISAWQGQINFLIFFWLSPASWGVWGQSWCSVADDATSPESFVTVSQKAFPLFQRDTVSIGHPWKGSPG